jgi:glucose/arabinose dehydrogenase
MRTFYSHLFVLILATVAAPPPVHAAGTGQGTSTPTTAVPRSAPMDAEAIDVQGHERLAWDQRAASPDELAGLGFVAYVNSQSQSLHSVSCSSTASAAGFECTAALPTLDSGVNVIEVAAYRITDPSEQGLRSPPMYLRVGAGSAGAMSQVTSHAPTRQLSLDRTWTSADGIRLRATTVAAGLDDPTDLLPLPDGRILVAERDGRVRVFRDGVLLPVPGLVLSDVAVGDGRGLLALAADHAFRSTPHVFATYTTDDGLRVARFTVAGDTLVDRAILVDGLPVAALQPAAILRTGPDGRLYLALDDGGDRDRLGDLGSYGGKVLRFAVDGTTPADQPSPSPVWSVGVGRPVGLSWSVDAATPRLIGIESPESAATEPPPAAGAAVTRLSLTPEVGAMRAAIGGGPALPQFRGDVIIASGSERAILRIRLSGDVPADVDWLVSDLPGPATALAVAPDGVIYVAVGSLLVRITAE